MAFRPGHQCGTTPTKQAAKQAGVQSLQLTFRLKVTPRHVNKKQTTVRKPLLEPQLIWPDLYLDINPTQTFSQTKGFLT